MSDHRRTVTRRALVLPGWALIGSAVVVVLAAGWLAWLLVSGPDDDAPVAAPTPSASPTPEPSESEPEPTPEPSEPEPTEEPQPEPSETTPAVDRSAVGVSVLNASRTQGLARTVGQQVTADGWTVATVGNWRGYSAANTVHYPQGREAEARQLAADLGIQAVAPLLNGMSGQRLTIVLVGPVGG